jgi:molybdopterin-synthase adenylyltransferase
VSRPLGEDDGAQLDRELARYSRQMQCPQIGPAGQRRLRQATVTLVGCGALGSVLASTLVRAGIGALRLIDRDFIEVDNLQRQMLFDEQDMIANLPKAEAAARKLVRINSAVEVEGIIADISPANIEHLCGSADLLLDGTDNLETRYLLNDLAVKHDIPWVYAACIATEGLVLGIIPHATPCLRCVWDTPPAPGLIATCDTAGILAATASVVGSLAATEAMKILVGRPGELGGLLAVDVWAGKLRRVNVQAAHEGADCPCCGQGRYEFLSGERGSSATALCGRDAVQVLPAAETQVNFRSIVNRLPSAARPAYSEYMLKFHVSELRVTLFRDGRAIVQGTTDLAVARGVIAKYVGT